MWPAVTSFLAVGVGDRGGGAVDQFAGTGKDRNFVLFHQEIDAANQFHDYAAFAFDHRWHVEFWFANGDAVGGQPCALRDIFHLNQEGF